MNNKATKPKVKHSLSRSQAKCLDLLFYIVIVGTFISMLGIILYYVYAFAALSNGSKAFDWLLGIFSDFVAIMSASLNNSPYVNGGASYPPIAIIVLYPFALICKNVISSYSELSLSIDELTSRIILHYEFWIAFFLFWLLCSLCVIIAVVKKYDFGIKNLFKLSVLILLSSPFIYISMRGNTIYFALAFLLIFFLLYENPKPWLREVAYFSLVLAGAIKIYPLFFGVFLLHKRKFFAAFRVGVYSIALFCLSFFLFEAGLGDISSFGENLGGFASDNVRLLEANNLSLSSLIFKLYYMISPDLVEAPIYYISNIFLLITFFCIAAVSAMIARSDFTRCVISSAVIILIPSISYFYVLSFMIIPFFEFIKNYDSLARYKQILYKIFFAFLFFTPFILAKNFILHSLIVIAMLCIETVSIYTSKKYPQGAC